ncbi:MAG TPA: lysylphosphatidylglycerol synthase transmembrane domain-containing protein [Vicinamibacterales bacterium]
MPDSGSQTERGRIEPARSAGGASRWLKLAVTLALYVLVFYRTDAGASLARLGAARPEFVAAAVILYMAGQAVSTWRWQLLLGPVGLRAAYSRLLGFYFTGMFFNLFLPTIIGGDAVKAVLLARETGRPARAAGSVFMERNVGLGSLLVVALVAAYLAPPVTLLGVPLTVLVWLIGAGYAVANLVLFRPHVYRIADRIVAATPLARFRPRAASLYEAIEPYTSARHPMLLAFVLSFAHQIVVIAVVFLGARALALDVPPAALAVFVPLVSLAGMIPVSVNGLGVREALYVLLFGRVGVPADAAVSLALLYLGVTLLASLPGGVAYLMQPVPARLLAAGRTAMDS